MSDSKTTKSGKLIVNLYPSKLFFFALPVTSLAILAGFLSPRSSANPLKESGHRD